MTTAEPFCEFDLPLLSNVEDIVVTHFMIDLKCDFHSKTFTGKVIYFLSPVCHNNTAACCSKLKYSEAPKPDFVLYFDCCNIDVLSVNEINDAHYTDSSSDTYHKKLRAVDALLTEKDLCRNFDYLYDHVGYSLNFSCNSWSLKISKPNVHEVQQFPMCLMITYQTRIEGQSLKWTNDQDGRPCVYTHGHWTNNRSLFPCQDVPGAMSSWQAKITADDGNIVLLSGDKIAQATPTLNGQLEYYSYSRRNLPSSTFTLAIGQWSAVTLCSGSTKDPHVLCYQADDAALCQCPRCVLPCRLYAPASMISSSEEEVRDYIPLCLSAASKLLGPHPFPRLDIVVAPQCFASLALACPSMMFISQTLLPGDGSNCIRLAHEICHSWFGLMIGPEDWTEEWLTEGIATYLEDIMHASVKKFSEADSRDFWELKAVIRRRDLMSEVDNSPQELQTLRLSGGQEESSDHPRVNYVKNGMHPDKTFTQVHYLKGYFLLRHLAGLVGQSQFTTFFKHCTQSLPPLITSHDLFSLLFKLFPSVQLDDGLTETQISTDWLDSPGLPQMVVNFTHNPNNSLIKEANREFDKWTTLIRTSRKRKFTGSSATSHFNCELISEQVVLILEWLMEMDSSVKHIMPLLLHTYDITRRNADVRHRWCELIVKHKYVHYYGDLRRFLIHDQAMGVYLFGELVISEDKRQLKLARKVFSLISRDMEEGPCVTIESMIYPTRSK